MAGELKNRVMSKLKLPNSHFMAIVDVILCKLIQTEILPIMYNIGKRSVQRELSKNRALKLDDDVR